MKVLVIDEWLPWPLGSGKRIRTYNLMARLARRHEILYLAYADLPREKDRVAHLESMGIQVVPVPDVRLKKWTFPFYLSVMANTFSRKPFTSAYHIKKPFTKKLLQVLAAEKPDLVHCEWTNLSPFLEHVKSVPTVVSAHNVESDIWRRLAENASNPLMRLVGRQQAARIERLEREWYPRADHCIAVSPEDANVITGYGAQVTVVENGVDTDHYDGFLSSKSHDHNSNQRALVFVASFDVFTNQEAVDFFMEKIFPIIENTTPNTDIWFVGKDPTEKIRNYARAHRRVHVTGTVEDVRDYISNALVSVVPIRIGGGSRLKILEAMAMKKPIVSTSIGAEGLRVEDGVNILLADTPEDFANKVRTLLNEQELRQSLAEAAWKLVRTEYDWDTLVVKQEMVWNTLHRSKSRSPSKS